MPIKASGIETYTDPAIISYASTDVVSTPYEQFVGTYSVDTPKVDIPKKTHKQANHLSRIIPRHACNKTVGEAVGLLRDVDFDTIAVRGVSGLLIGPLLAYVMQKELLVIRKDGDRSASAYREEGHIAAKRYIIADDLISTSSTCVQIVRHIRDSLFSDAQLVGVLLYNDCDSTHFYDQNSRKVLYINTCAADKEWSPIR